MNAPHPALAHDAGRTHGLGRPFVLVTGGKGGVGKSTLAANLGVLLTELGADPLLLDLDFGLANLDLLLGTKPARHVEHFLNDGVPLESCVHRGPASLALLAAGSGNADMARPDARRLERLVRGVRELDPPPGLVLGDSAAGIGPEVLTFAAHADRVLVVTTPEPAAVTDAYGVIKAIDATGARLGREVPTPELFVNFASGVDEAHRVAEGLREVCERFLARAPRLVGWMPRSRTVLQGVIRQIPFVLSDPQALAARCLRRLARHYGSPAVLGGISPLKGSESHVR
jgi:flagellar biosynthesis protein FlhG